MRGRILLVNGRLAWAAHVFRGVSFEREAIRTLTPDFQCGRCRDDSAHPGACAYAGRRQRLRTFWGWPRHKMDDDPLGSKGGATSSFEYTQQDCRGHGVSPTRASKHPFPKTMQNRLPTVCRRLDRLKAHQAVVAHMPVVEPEFLLPISRMSVGSYVDEHDGLNLARKTTVKELEKRLGHPVDVGATHCVLQTRDRRLAGQPLCELPPRGHAENLIVP